MNLSSFNLHKLFLSLALLSLASASYGQSTEKIKADLQRQLGSKVQIKSVSASPIPGLFEVVANNNIIYTDASGKYILQGEIVELKTGQNITENRQNELNRVNWADLPLQNAVKVVRGNGARKVAVFADPNCGYCKRLEKTFTEMDNITIYTFLIPILSPDSGVKAKQIWCAADAAKSWVSWMTNAVTPSGKSDCSTPIEKNLALAKTLNISGTPAIFFTDGSRIPGAVDKDGLEKKLASLPSVK